MRRRRRPRTGVLLVAVASIGLASLLSVPAAAAPAAVEQTYLDVSFGGNFNTGDAYTSATGETKAGELVRRNGSETLDPGLGIVLGGGEQGLNFTPTGLDLGGTTLDRGFVLETTFTPGNAQTSMGTLLAVAGNFSVRYQDGALRYGFDAIQADGWTSHAQSVDLPTPGSAHAFSIAYLPSGTDGARVYAWLDGTALPAIEADARAAVVGDAAAPVGIGNDVHPAALSRGFVGSLRQVRFATATGPFDPAMFTLQDGPFLHRPLLAGFTGSLDGEHYLAGPAESLVAPLTVTGGTIPASGRLQLHGPDSGLSFPLAGLGAAALDQPVLLETVVDPDLLTAGTVLADLAGSVTLTATGASTVELRAGDTVVTRELPQPQTRGGEPIRHLALLATPTDAGTRLTIAGAAGPLGDPVDVPALATAGTTVRQLTGATGIVYGVAISTGATIDQLALADLPCAVPTVEPAAIISVTPGECAPSVLAKAAALRPTDRQLRWQQAERTAFLHFGMNTFTGNEWGDGNEDPDLFRPTDLDTDQWARALRDNGFRYAILTVKHHDGFVLYPSRYTEHDVASSTWRGGDGDVLRAFTDSAHRYGLKVGIYLSPADWNSYRNGVFANGSEPVDRTIPTLVPGDDRAGKDLPMFSYRASDYGAYFLNQLYETLTEYGPIDEVWFDGADGGIPGADAEHYDFDAWYDLIRNLQPQATIAVSGPDVRWVGNEGGLARDDEWSTVPTVGGPPSMAVPATAAEIGTDRALVSAVAGGADSLAWYPAEVDVSIRPGWFHHPEQSPKSVDQLSRIYYRSAGHNAVLLLNVPPDTAGHLPAADVQRLAAWNAALRRDMPKDLAVGAPVTADGGTDPAAVTDGDDSTSWVAPGASSGAVTIDLGERRTVDRIAVMEDIADGGQVVRRLAIDARRADGSWAEVTTAGTVGYRRIIALDAPVDTAALRVRILDSRAPVHLATVSVFGSRSDDVPRRHTYHLDCSAGSAGIGTADDPMNSFAQLRQVDLPASAEVLLRAGTSCAGPLELWGYGTDTAPAVLGRYGDGPDPVLTGGHVAAAVATLRQQGWRLDGVHIGQVTTSTELTVTPPTRTYGTDSTVVAAAVSTDDGRPAEGTVTFTLDGRPAGTSSVTGDGVASWEPPDDLRAGPHTVAAEFVPADRAVLRGSASAERDLTIHKALTSIDVTAVGGTHSVTVTATVRSGTDLPPSGSVSVNVDGRRAAVLEVAPHGGTSWTGTATVPARPGTAVLVVTFLPADTVDFQRSTAHAFVPVRR